MSQQKYSSPLEIDTGDERANALIKKYCMDQSVHSLCMVTYEDVYRKVWERIKAHKEKEELKKRLIQEVTDGEGLCFTGRLSRLVNTLVHYYDDIQMSISDNAQINAKILAAKNKVMEDTKEGDPEFPKKWKNLAKEYLEEILVPPEEIKNWLEHIYEEEEENNEEPDKNMTSESVEEANDEDM